MQATDLFNWAPTFSVQPNEDLITIHVDADWDVFRAHRKVLTTNSGFFARALGNTGYAETKAGEISLPEASSRAFTIWLDWAYNGKIPSAVLDVKLGQIDGELTTQAVSMRRQVVSSASWRLMIANARGSIVDDIRDGFIAQTMASLSRDHDNISVSDQKERQTFLEEQLRDAPGKQQGLRKLIQYAIENLDALAHQLGMIQESRDLRSSFFNMCKEKILATQKDPELRQNFIGEHGPEPGTDEEMRPSFVNLIRLYRIADFLLSEKCKNMVIDAVAELSYNTRYVPNAVDVGELWGYDDETGDIEELKAPERTRNLKQLVRRIYCSKNTSKLLLLEQDSYPETFLRELNVLSRDQACSTDKWAWSIASTRCTAFHTHIDTSRCVF